MIGSRSRIMLVIAGAAILVSLTGCNKERHQKEAADFGQACGKAGFSSKQCAFLYAIREDARDRADESDALALVGLNAANVAAVNAARR